MEIIYWSKMNRLLTLQADSAPPPTQICVERMLWNNHRQLQSELVKTSICTCCKTSATPPLAIFKAHIKHPFAKCAMQIILILFFLDLIFSNSTIKC